MQDFIIIEKNKNYIDSKFITPTPASLHNWQQHQFNDGKTTIYVSPSTRIHFSKSKRTVIIGNIYRRSALFNYVESNFQITEDDEEILEKTENPNFQKIYWGNYIGIKIKYEAFNSVFRGPDGAIPCYYANLNTGTLYFSDLEKATHFLPRNLQKNKKYLSHQLSYYRYVSDETALLGISNLCPGFVTNKKNNKLIQIKIWDPVAFSNKKWNASYVETVDILRETMLHSIRHQSEILTKSVMFLSGGFDSSLLAGLLDATLSTHEIFGLNYWIPNSRSSDETYFASLVESSNSIPITTIPISPCDANILHFNQFKASPSPSPQYLATALWQASISQADSKNCLSISDGGGGDQIFYAFETELIFTDCLRARNGLTAKMASILDASKLTNKSIWSVIKSTATNRKIRSADDLYREILKIQKRFLSPEVLSLCEAKTLVPPALRDEILPAGKVKQIAGILNMSLNDIPLRRNVYPYRHPLVNDPIIELCLQIPSYLHTQGGVSRGLARRAAIDLIPKEIVNRFSKGGTEKFVEYWASNLETKNFLKDSLLIKDGYLVEGELEIAFSLPEFRIKQDIVDVLHTEIWMRRMFSWQKSREFSSFAKFVE